MAQTTIEWTSRQREDGSYMNGYTLNLIWGCTKVHEGCDNCYADSWANRWGKNIWGNDNPREIKYGWQKLVKKWQKEAEKLNEVHIVFCGSMFDIFEKDMPLIDSKGNSIPTTLSDLRKELFEQIIPSSPNLFFLLLTKRPSNINKHIPTEWKTNCPTNVMFGTSIANTSTAKNLIPLLKTAPSRIFLSIEPQLAEIIPTVELFGGIDWIIQGGESGAGKRPFNPDWARIMRDFCKEQHIPYFFKQWDKVKQIPQDLQIREFPTITQEVSEEEYQFNLSMTNN